MEQPGENTLAKLTAAYDRLLAWAPESFEQLMGPTLVQLAHPLAEIAISACRFGPLGLPEHVLTRQTLTQIAVGYGIYHSQLEAEGRSHRRPAAYPDPAEVRAAWEQERDGWGVRLMDAALQNWPRGTAVEELAKAQLAHARQVLKERHHLTEVPPAMAALLQVGLQLGYALGAWEQSAATAH